MMPPEIIAAMAAVFDKPPFLQRFVPSLQGFDGPLAFAVFLLACAGLLTMYSSGFDHGTRFADHARNMLLAGFIMFVVAQVPPQRLMSFAVPVYTIGVALLIAVALFGLTKKGARRWINVGVVIQPSEILKIATPLMLAWWFQKREGQLRPLDFMVAALLLAVPVGLIMKQPDLGTSLLVLAAGVSVIFFAGLPWKLIVPPVALGLVAGVLLIVFEPQLCAQGVRWPVLHDYQQQRICTLLDPGKDPLGKGFHIIQGMIAIGSGGFFHLRRLLGGVRPRRQPAADRRLPVPGAARPGHRAGGLDAVLAAAGRRHHHDLLHLCLREHGHGERHPAGGGRAAAVHQLRRHRDGDAGHGAGHPDVDRQGPAAGADLMRTVPRASGS
jgi:hypothetical protein